MLFVKNNTICSRPYEGHALAISDNTLPYHSFFKQWSTGFILGLLLLFCFTYISSSTRFQKALYDDNAREVPLVPYWIPGVFHAFALWDPAAFAFRLSKRYGSRKPLQVKAGWLRFFLLSEPEHVKALFRNSRHTTNTATVAFTLRNLVDLPDETVSLYLDDRSGAGLKPRKDSNVLPERRITFLVSHNLHMFLSSCHLDGISRRYSTMLHRQINDIDIQSEWVSLPNLFNFLQRTTLVSEIEALFGLKLLELNPRFIDDLLIFTQHVPDFLRLRPWWLNPQAYRARRRLIQYVKQWHEYARKHVDFADILDEDPDWEPFWGSKLMRVRQQYEHKTMAMNSDARACEDVGLIWASTTNVQNTVFWLFFEVLRDPDLQMRLMKEISECKTTNGEDDTTGFDMKKLTNQPLLQSTYAEVLRLYVAVAISRIAGYEDIKIDDYMIPQDSLIMTYSRAMALDTDAWIRAGRTLNKPLDEFDAERFLVDSGWTRPGLTPAVVIKDDGKRRFSTDGLLGLWVPYGGGDHMCPGRHLAKQQMLVTFALLLSEFDIEISATKVEPDMRFAPFGSLPPKNMTGFRIRRKQQVAN
ncbi:Cholesterol 7-alpha-monooxygenase [Daldinia childiae]|uniref:Cholesterol 7-alpha-monooxygenase n=1 Tax=Daldinia childiae TaxID=326645 RepID=UPI00144701BB|nr:Cholesterol 7-alpha-monooxygenase [Daldinia childiae]KAF3055561.1 Cholesterol 7-alpha-monooxygenase [Daldinia childiae]